MQGLFLDAGSELSKVYHAVARSSDPPVTLNSSEQVASDTLPELVAGYGFVLNDHTFMPTDVMARCKGLKHVVFLGTGARSYMDPDALAGLGIQVHTIKGYGDTAVAEHAVALMWAAARGVARMDAAVRSGRWLRTEGMQLSGKTIGLIGFGGIAGEVARIAIGIGMRVLAWNRSPRVAAGVEFVPLEQLLAESHVVSLHLSLTDETRGFLGSTRLSQMRLGAILVNTARAAVVDEAAMVGALQSGALSHAALDVFDVEPLPPGHLLTTLDNVTLSAHSAFRTAEASETLIRRALDIACEVAKGG